MMAGASIPANTMFSSLNTSGIRPKHTILTITPAAKDRSQHTKLADGFFSNIAEIRPPSPIPQIPAIALNNIICTILIYFN
jgi:hypothetical protein